MKKIIFILTLILIMPTIAVFTGCIEEPPPFTPSTRPATINDISVYNNWGATNITINKTPLVEINNLQLVIRFENNNRQLIVQFDRNMGNVLRHSVHSTTYSVNHHFTLAQWATVHQVTINVISGTVPT